MEQYLIFGRKGKLERKLYEIGGDAELKAPLVECDAMDFMPPVPCFHVMQQKRQLFPYLEDAYREWRRFGHYGDVMQITMIENGKYGKYELVINFIGRLAFPKGVIAIDLLPFIIDGSGTAFFIGTKRPKKSAYPDKPALIGGHVDLKGNYFESTVQAVMREAWEEVKIDMRPGIYKADLGSEPLAEAKKVIFLLGDVKARTLLMLHRSIRPSEGKENKDMPYRRVDWAFAYYMIVETDVKLSKKKLLPWLKGGEDTPMVVNVDRDKVPDFAFAHHTELYNSACAKLFNFRKAMHGLRA